MLLHSVLFALVPNFLAMIEVTYPQIITYDFKDKEYIKLDYQVARI